MGCWEGHLGGSVLSLGSLWAEPLATTSDTGILPALSTFPPRFSPQCEGWPHWTAGGALPRHVQGLVLRRHRSLPARG